MVCSGPLAGLGLYPSDLGFLGSPEVTTAHLQKELNTILSSEKAMCHLKKCDRHVAVFALSKHGQQLHEHQCLTAWLFSGMVRAEKSLGRHEATGRDWPHAGLGEHTQGSGSTRRARRVACSPQVSPASFSARGPTGPVPGTDLLQGL